MKWVYGKQDWKTFERGLENCYLMTNGLGGFSSLTMTGAAARGDHAFFMACTEAPNHRYNMIQRLEEEIAQAERAAQEAQQPAGPLDEKGQPIIVIEEPEEPLPRRKGGGHG